MSRPYVLSIRDARPEGGLSVNVKDVLAAVGHDVVDGFQWCVFDLDATGPSASELADAVRVSDGELFLTGLELRGVAEGLDQTIEGELVAFPGSLSRESLTAVDFELVAFPDNRMSVAILVVDSSFFVLYLKDALLVARVKASFKVVREEAAENYF